MRPPPDFQVLLDGVHEWTNLRPDGFGTSSPIAPWARTSPDLMSKSGGPTCRAAHLDRHPSWVRSPHWSSDGSARTPPGSTPPVRPIGSITSAASWTTSTVTSRSFTNQIWESEGPSDHRDPVRRHRGSLRMTQGASVAAWASTYGGVARPRCAGTSARRGRSAGALPQGRAARSAHREGRAHQRHRPEEQGRRRGQ